MKRLSIISSFLFSVGLIMLTGNPGIPGYREESANKIQGVVLDRTGKGIGFARIVVIPLTDASADTKSGKSVDFQNKVDMRVVYSNSKGSWQIGLPDCSSFVVQAYSNAYETVEKHYRFEARANNHPRIELILSQGLSHILWGSIEHIQLYIPPLHQKNIEHRVRAGYLKSLENYIRSNIEPDEKKHVWLFAGYLLFENARPKISKIYFDRAGSRLWFNLMGKDQMRMGCDEEALEYYLKGEITRDRANHLLHLAKNFETRGDMKNAELAYQGVMVDFRSLVSVLKYKWDKNYLDSFNVCLNKLKKKAGMYRERETGDEDVQEILYKAGKYCERLDKAKFYYYCYEVKYDRVFLINKLVRALENPARFFRKYSQVKLRGNRIVDHYKYDLQFVKEPDEFVTEKRELLMMNLDSTGSGIPVLSYSVLKPLHGPNTLVGFDWQDLFRYKKISEERIYGEEAVVLEATPKFFNKQNRMSGKIWINKQNGCVLKIEWHNRNVLNREQIRAMGLILERTPQLKVISEFRVTRGGLRFPSRCVLLESYVNQNKKDFIRLTIEIDYKNYQFFRVSSEVEMDD